MRRAAHSGPAQAETMKIEIQKKIAQVRADMNTSLNPLRKQESYKAWDLCAFISKKSFMSQCFFLCVPYVKWMTTRHGTHLFDVSVQYTPQPFLLFSFFFLTYLTKSLLWYLNLWISIRCTAVLSSSHSPCGLLCMCMHANVCCGVRLCDVYGKTPFRDMESGNRLCYLPIYC